jgi:hypothetical protein
VAVPPFALVDCNNFYGACEKLFDPQLRDCPIVVLLSNAAVSMGVLWFQIQAKSPPAYGRTLYSVWMQFVRSAFHPGTFISKIMA